MMGGEQEPCIPRRQIPKWEEKFGRLCPRVELDPRNMDAHRIAMHGIDRISIPEGPLAGVADSILTGIISAIGMRRGVRKASLAASLGLAAIVDPEVVALVKQRNTPPKAPKPQKKRR